MNKVSTGVLINIYYTNFNTLARQIYTLLHYQTMLVCVCVQVPSRLRCKCAPGSLFPTRDASKRKCVMKLQCVPACEVNDRSSARTLHAPWQNLRRLVDVRRVPTTIDDCVGCRCSIRCINASREATQ